MPSGPDPASPPVVPCTRLDKGRSNLVSRASGRLTKRWALKLLVKSAARETDLGPLQLGHVPLGSMTNQNVAEQECTQNLVKRWSSSGQTLAKRQTWALYSSDTAPWAASHCMAHPTASSGMWGAVKPGQARVKLWSNSGQILGQHGGPKAVQKTNVAIRLVKSDLALWQNDRPTHPDACSSDTRDKPLGQILVQHWSKQTDLRPLQLEGTNPRSNSGPTGVKRTQLSSK